MGRRWGKSTLGGIIIMNVLRQHGRAAWIVPEYRNGRALWRYAANICAPLEQAKKMQISKSERVITTSQGGFFGIYSADNIDSVRSEWFHVVVGDEAARISEDGWNDAVRPTLADADGDEILISTPKGKNWFFYEWTKGQQGVDGYKSWTAPSNDNPLPNIRKAYALARTRVSERTFLQEWMAQFVDDGSIFRNIHELSTLIPQEPIKDLQYVIGVDWGRVNDATVFCVLSTNKKQVYVDRMTDTDYASQRLRLKALSEKYNNALIVAESNSMGQPNIEALQSMNVPITGFTTTNATKASIIQSLELELEKKEVNLLNNSMQITELMAYESKKLPSGLIRYGAPNGMHDDMVMSLALALYAAQRGNMEVIDNPFFM